jgi:hypothetical protein
LPNSPSYKPKLFTHLSKLFQGSISEYKCQDERHCAGEYYHCVEDVPPPFIARLGVGEEGLASNEFQSKNKVNVYQQV